MPESLSPQKRQQWARYLLRLERVLHPRLFRLLLNGAWPYLHDADGTLPAVYGPLTLRTDLRDGAERQIFLRTYDPPLLHLVRRLARPGWNVADIGANMGIVATVAAGLVGETGSVVAVEPNPRLAERLRHVASTNPLQNLNVFEVAVADRPGTLDFYISSAHTYSTLKADFLPDYPLERVIKVRVVTLQDVFHHPALAGKIDLLKIDAEGVDFDILLQAQREVQNAPPKAMIIETSKQEFSSVFQMYRQLGYRFFLMSKTKVNELTPVDQPVIPPNHNILLVHEGLAMQGVGNRTV